MYWPVNYLGSAIISYDVMDIILGWVSSYKLLKGGGPFYPRKFVETGSLLKTPLVSSERKKIICKKKLGWISFLKWLIHIIFNYFYCVSERFLISFQRIEFSIQMLSCSALGKEQQIWHTVPHSKMLCLHNWKSLISVTSLSIIYNSLLL